MMPTAGLFLQSYRRRDVMHWAKFAAAMLLGLSSVWCLCWSVVGPYQNWFYIITSIWCYDVNYFWDTRVTCMLSFLLSLSVLDHVTSLQTDNGSWES